MEYKSLIENVKNAVFEVEPNAEIILYGSRARDDSTSINFKKRGCVCNAENQVILAWVIMLDRFEANPLLIFFDRIFI